MFYCMASCSFSSVLNFAKRHPGSSSFAACQNTGEKLLQGPRQDTQQSTSTGISVLPSTFEALSANNVTALPSNNSSLHFSQLGPSSRRP